MGNLRKVFLPILITGIWINISETVRWIFLIKSYWIKHYQTMNLVFPNNLINGIVWMICDLYLLQSYSFYQRNTV